MKRVCYHKMIVRPKAKRVDCEICNLKVPFPPDSAFRNYMFSDVYVCDHCHAVDREGRAHISEMDTPSGYAYLWKCLNCGVMSASYFSKSS